MMIKTKAFTLAEVLVTLVLIGVVAALTVPHAQMYIRDAQYLNRLKKFYSTANQAFKHRMAQDGVTDIGYSSIISSINGESTASGNQNGFTVEMMRIFKVISTFNAGEYSGNKEYRSVEKPPHVVSTNNDYVLILTDGTIMRMDMKTTPEEGVPKEVIKANGGKLYKIYGYVDVDVNGDNEPNRWGYDNYRFVVGQDGFFYPYKGKDYQIFIGSTPYTNYDADCPGGDGYSCAARIIEKDWTMDYL